MAVIGLATTPVAVAMEDVLPTAKTPVLGAVKVRVLGVAQEVAWEVVKTLVLEFVLVFCNI